MIDDEPINENLEYILQEATENNNDFGIQKKSEILLKIAKHMVTFTDTKGNKNDRRRIKRTG